ncbi:MAG: hypothetical protein ACOYOV_13645 [Bacteroidales bacterium]
MKINPILRNSLSVVAGIIVGSAVNMGIIMISSSIIPPPAGADLTTMEGLKTSMHLLQPQHFILPFLAHSLGSFVGGLLTAIFVSNFKMRYSLGIGVWFLIGGISNILMLPSPLWFTITDLALAYIPMAYLAGIIVIKRDTKTIDL